MRRLLAHACVLAGLLGVTAAGHAQSAPTHGVALNWVRLADAERCIAAVDLARRVEQRLGRQVFSRTSDAILVVEGRVGPGLERGFTSVIHVSDPDGTLYGSREVSVPDSDCHKLDEVIALVISVTLRHEGGAGISLPASIAAQLDSLFAEESSELDPRQLAPAAAADSSPEPAAPAPAPSTRDEKLDEQAWRVQLEAALGMTSGLAPAPSFAPLLRVQLRHRQRYSLALEGRLGLTQAQRIASEPRGSLAYGAYAFALLGCVTPLGASALELSVCVDGRVGSLSVSGVDFLYSYGARQLWFELAAAASVRAHLLGPTYAHLRIGLPWRAIRPRFQYRDSQGAVRDAFTVAALGLDLSLGLGVEF